MTSAANFLEWEIQEQIKLFTSDKFVHRVSTKNNNIKNILERNFFSIYM